MPQGIAPYGYIFSEDRSRFVPDGEAGDAVRMIFQWTMMGLAPVRIAERLSLMGYVTPGERRKEIVKGKSVAHTGQWKSFMVRNVLQNPQYEGDVVLGRKISALYLSKQNVKVNPEEWVVRKNAHEPLVSRENHKEAMKQAEQYQIKNEVVKKREQLGCQVETDGFEGLVFCAECRQKMYFIRRYHDFDKTKDETGGYVCSSNMRYNACNGRFVYADYLKIVVMDQIQLLAQTMCDRKKLLEKLKLPESKHNALAAARNRVQRIIAQLNKEEERKTLLYENFAEGILEEEDYINMKTQRTAAIETLRSQKTQAEETLRRCERAVKKYSEMTAQLEEHLSDREFNPALVKELIERIYIGNEGNVEIHFRCNDVFAAVDEMLQEVSK